MHEATIVLIYSKNNIRELNILNRITFISKLYYFTRKIQTILKWLIKNYLIFQEGFILLLIEIKDDIVEGFFDFLKYIDRGMLETEAYFEKEKKKFFAQNEEEYKIFYDEMIWTLKVGIVLFVFACYIRNLDNPLYVSNEIFISWEELKIKLPPIVEGPFWNQDLLHMYICQNFTFYMDPDWITHAWEDIIYPYDFRIGVEWFLY